MRANNLIEIDTKKLRRHAEEERWSDSAIARKSGLTQSGVTKVMNGKVHPRAGTLKLICDTIAIPIEEVFVKKHAA